MDMKIAGTAVLIAAAGVLSVARGEPMNGEAKSVESVSETATFGAGCFWCVEAVFEKMPGVESVASGYQGGELKEPEYKEICRGDTGHAEVVRIEFDPSVIGFDKLLNTFWKAHDPTQLNRQGADVGTQYRSVVFYHSEEQREKAEASKAAADKSGAFSKPIVTQIVPAEEFYQAEGYHQDFYRNNPNHGYSRAIIQGKLKKLGLE